MVKKRSYAVANGLLSALSVISVLLIVVGFIGIFGDSIRTGLGDGTDLFFMAALKMASVGAFLGGLVMLALVQIARAQVHSAEMTWEMLEMMRKAEKT